MIRLAQAFAREAIAEKVQATGKANALLTEQYLNKTMKEFEDELDVKFGILFTTIYTHTDGRLKTINATIAHHNNNLQAHFDTIVHKLQQSNIPMQS